MIINVVKCLESVGMSRDHAQNLLEGGLICKGHKKSGIPVTTENIEIEHGDKIYVTGETYLYFLFPGETTDFKPVVTTSSANRNPLSSSIDKLPEGVTLENFQEKTGSRFRMTKQEKDAGLTREEAFAKRFGK